VGGSELDLTLGRWIAGYTILDWGFLDWTGLGLGVLEHGFSTERWSSSDSQHGQSRCSAGRKAI
jgi:hypothetical protein